MQRCGACCTCCSAVSFKLTKVLKPYEYAVLRSAFMLLLVRSSLVVVG
jgi:hypothetical protein